MTKCWEPDWRPSIAEQRLMNPLSTPLPSIYQSNILVRAQRPQSRAILCHRLKEQEPRSGDGIEYCTRITTQTMPPISALVILLATSNILCMSSVAFTIHPPPQNAENSRSRLDDKNYNRTTYLRSRKYSNKTR